MHSLLTVDWYAVEDLLTSFFAIVLAPAVVLGFVYLISRYKTNKKMEVMLAAIERGVQLDPAFYCKQKKNFEENAQKRFLSGAIVGLIGVALCVTGAFTADKIHLLSLIFFVPGGITSAIGAGLVLSFLVGRKASGNK